MILRTNPAPARRVLAALLVTALVACLVGGVLANTRAAPQCTGRVLYRSNRSPVPGVLVEIVEAENDGRPTDEVLGSTHADAEGRFTVELTKATDEPVTLVVSAVRESAASGGDRRGEGYEIKTHRTLLGFLPHPSLTKANTVLIERRRPGQNVGDSEDN